MKSIHKLCLLVLAAILIFAIGCSGDSGANLPQRNESGSTTETGDDTPNDDTTSDSGATRTLYEKIDLTEYAKMTDEEIGQLRWALKVADADLDDFSLIPSLNVLGIPITGIMNLAFASYRFSIAFYTYYLATIQYHKIPACHDIIQSRMDRLIQKMQEGAVWKYWALTSTGLYTFFAAPMTGEEPGLYRSAHDPVAEKNIMYSGHLAQMITLYEKLYGDMKWDEEGAIKFTWNRREEYTYSTTTLLELLRDAYINLPAHCIECEPNMCFAECNQHPMLALKVYDQVHGTDFLGQSIETTDPENSPFALQKRWFEENDLIDPDTHNTCVVYFPLTGKKIGPDPDDWDTGNFLSLLSIPIMKLLQFKIASALEDGWTMAFMHGWQKDFIDNHYWGTGGEDGGNRANRLDPDTLKIEADVVWNDNLDLFIIYDSLSVPFYGMLAGEVGDEGARAAIMEQCDGFFEPKWTEDGEFHYPVGGMDMIIGFESEKMPHIAIGPTGALAGIVRSNPPDGLYKLHSDPVPGAGGPMVENIDIYKTNLRRAVYDSDVQALIITTDIGPLAEEGDMEDFKITNMNKSGINDWVLIIDGEVRDEYSGESEIDVSIPLDGPHDIILAAEG